MKIKTFYGESDEVINAWLEDNEIRIIDIKRKPIHNYFDNGKFMGFYIETIIIY
jgi:hypothetical protein